MYEIMYVPEFWQVRSNAVVNGDKFACLKSIAQAHMVKEPTYRRLMSGHTAAVLWNITCTAHALSV
jgi:hypothetical protein